MIALVAYNKVSLINTIAIIIMCYHYKNMEPAVINIQLPMIVKRQNLEMLVRVTHFRVMNSNTLTVPQ